MPKIIIVGRGIVGASLYHILRDRGIEAVVVDNDEKKVFPTLIHSMLLKGSDVELAYRSLNIYKKFNIEIKEFVSFTIGSIPSEYINNWREYGIKVDFKYIEWLNKEVLVAIGSDRLVNVKQLVSRVPYIKGEAKIIINREKEAKIIINREKELIPDYIILTAGAWSKYILISTSLPTKSYFCWAILGISNKRELDKIIIYDYELGFYTRPFLGLELPLFIAGNGESIEAKPWEKVIVKDEELLVSKLKLRFGNIKKIVRYGNYCEATPDMRPIYGKLADNLYYIGGLNGYGAEVGPALAEILVNYMFYGKEEFKEYNIDRFKKWDQNFKIDKEPHEL